MGWWRISGLRPDHSGMVITLQLFGSFAEWRYLKCHSTSLLADGVRVKLGEVEFHGDISRHGGVYERIQVILTAAALARIGSASKIEFKVCNDEFQATEEFVRAAHEFACKVAKQFVRRSRRKKP